MDSIKYNELRIRKEIGAGSYATVYEAVHGRAIVAFKQLTYQIDPKEEAELLIKAKHTNIIGLLGMIDDPDHTGMVMEYMNEGDLKSFLMSYDADDDSQRKLRQKFAKSLIQGLAYLSVCRIIHRDLSAKNILLDTKKPLKIADFGFAIQLKDNEDFIETAESAGTPLYMPPEAYVKDPQVGAYRFSLKSDIYSCATILSLLASHSDHRPYRHIKNLNNAIAQAKAGIPPRSNHLASESCAKLLTRCWSKEPENRPSAQDIAQEFKDGLQLFATDSSRIVRRAD